MSNLSREFTSTSDICHGAARGWTLLLGTVMVIESKINKRLLGTSSDHPEVAEILRKSVPLKQLHKDVVELMDSMKKVKSVDLAINLAAKPVSTPSPYIKAVRKNIHFERIFNFMSVLCPQDFSCLYLLLWQDHLPVGQAGLFRAHTMAPSKTLISDDLHKDHAAYKTHVVHTLGCLIIHSVLLNDVFLTGEAAACLDAILSIPVAYKWDYKE